ALAAARRCLELGAQVRAHDPEAMAEAEQALPEVSYCDSPYDCVRGSDAVLLATAWQEYRDLDLDRMAALMHGGHVFDGRNCLSARSVARTGLRYHGVGRGVPVPEVAGPRPQVSAPALPDADPTVPVPTPST
ncbi:MAG: UDP binding domain-containing protein, partial [Armatimonadota bacterium]